MINLVERNENLANYEINLTKRNIQEIEKKNMTLHQKLKIIESKPDCIHGFPFTIPHDGTIVPMHLKIIKIEYSNFNVEIFPKRNYQWLNSHVPSAIMMWRENCDFQLILDTGKVIQYITKYMTKLEAICKKRKHYDEIFF